MLKLKMTDFLMIVALLSYNQWSFTIKCSCSKSTRWLKRHLSFNYDSFLQLLSTLKEIHFKHDFSSIEQENYFQIEEKTRYALRQAKH